METPGSRNVGRPLGEKENWAGPGRKLTFHEWRLCSDVPSVRCDQNSSHHRASSGRTTPVRTTFHVAKKHL